VTRGHHSAAEKHFQLGMELQMKGAIDQAAQQFKFCIQAAPGHAPAHHMLGLICAWRGKLAAASELISAAIRLQPGDAAMLINLGNVQKLMGRVAEALQTLDTALKLAPDHIDALNNRGVLLGELGRHGEAVETLSRAMSLHPAAIEVRCNLGKALRDAGQKIEALAVYEESVRQQAGHPGSRIGLGRILVDLKRPDEAIVHLREALRLKPQDADACNELGNAFVLLARYRDALPWYRQALALKPDLKQALGNLGYALQEAGVPEEAIGMLDRAVEAAPDDLRLHISRATVLQRLGRLEEALASLQRARELDSRDVAIHVNLGNVLQNLDRLDEAVQAYRDALAIDPESVDARWNLAIARLGRSEFEAGWQLYESRWQVRNFHAPVVPISRNLWSQGGESGEVLVWAEQGLGDELMLSGFLPAFKELCPQARALVDQRLVSLLSRSYPEIEFLPRKKSVLPDFDSHLPFGSVPSRLTSDARRSRFENWKPLRADPDRVARMREALPRSPRLRVGLSWRSQNHKIGNAKSIRLETLKRLLSIPGVVFVNLQYGDVQDEIQDLQIRTGLEIIQVPGLDIRADIDGTAALIEACDFVITTSNTTAHLTGSLGKKAALLAPTGLGLIWYWRNRIADRSVWYPAMTILDQSSEGSWDPAIQEAIELLSVPG
jgi:tetratricopeptide (TPR) repeat protein